ncbi:MAG: YceI family protein [Planctomycetaceae bacterium]
MTLRVRLLFAVASLCALSVAPARAAQEYDIDPAHTALYFKVSHFGYSDTHGRFNDMAGKFTIDPDPAKVAFDMTIKVKSVDTGNKTRDEHLLKPDFFNEKQYPLITFKSTAVKAADGGYDVTGDLTMHGTTKPITLALRGGKTGEFPPGIKRTGYSTTLDIKRSDFGMSKMLDGIGDDVHLSISFEGMKEPPQKK